MANKGVIYICWGEPAIYGVESSIKSLRIYVPTMPIVVVGDNTTVVHFSNRNHITPIECLINPFNNKGSWGFMAGKIKPLLANLSPFDETLYVDADTEFKTSPDFGFELLKQWDFVVAEAETRSLAITFQNNKTEAVKTAEWLGTSQILYHNSGMFFWRRNLETDQLFQLWETEWKVYKGWDEQIALLRALLKSKVIFLTVPYTWNCRGPVATFFVYHQFASRSARKFSGYVDYPTSSRLAGVASRSNLVEVEIAPGVLIKCKPGDETKVVQAMALQRGKRHGRNNR